jgi:hypothetical protein
MFNNSKSYTAEELDKHFGDCILPSTSQQSHSKSSPATFNIWKIEPIQQNTSANVHLMDVDINDAATTDPIPVDHQVLSRLTIFSKSAQPLYPPAVYTRSEATILSNNIGRIIPVFHTNGPTGWGTYRWDGYVKIVAMEVIPGRSDELRNFISKKVQYGGLKKERTKEQWEETFGSDWCKVTIACVVTQIGNPMDIANIRDALNSLMGKS